MDNRLFQLITTSLARFIGRPVMMILCMLLAAASFAAYASRSELLINGTNLAINVLTLMFLPILQATQNRDGAALQAGFLQPPGHSLRLQGGSHEAEISPMRAHKNSLSYTRPPVLPRASRTGICPCTSSHALTDRIAPGEILQRDDLSRMSAMGGKLASADHFAGPEVPTVDTSGAYRTWAITD